MCRCSFFQTIKSNYRAVKADRQLIQMCCHLPIQTSLQVMVRRKGSLIRVTRVSLFPLSSHLQWEGLRCEGKVYVREMWIQLRDLGCALFLPPLFCVSAVWALALSSACLLLTAEQLRGQMDCSVRNLFLWSNACESKRQQV